MFESQLAQAASGPVSVFAPETVAAAEVPKTDAGPVSGAAAAAGQQPALPGHPEHAEGEPVPEPVQPMAADAAG